MTRPAVTNATISSGTNWILRVSGVCAAATGLLLLIAIPAMLPTAAPATSSMRGFAALQGNWLVSIFKIHAGFPGATTRLLDGATLLDTGILLLFGLVGLGLWAALRRVSKWWSLVALVQPFLGILLLWSTGSAGRSSLMGAALVFSLVMLRGGPFSRAVAWMGIIASALLLIGDLTAGVLASIVVAAMFAIAYALFTLWLFLLSRSLLTSSA